MTLAKAQRSQRIDENDIDENDMGRAVRFDEGSRADIIVENEVTSERKSVERITNAHKKPLLTWLNLTGTRRGYLLSFGEAVMKTRIT